MNKKRVIIPFALLGFATFPLTTQATGAPSATATTPKVFINNQGATNFKIETDKTNLNVSVPLHVTLVASPNGGAITAPTKQSYVISNHTYLPVVVTNLKFSVTDDDWTMTQNSLQNIAYSKIAGDIGDIHLTFTPDSHVAGQTTAFAASNPADVTASAPDSVDLSSQPQEKRWLINGTDEASKPKKLEIDISGTTTRLKKITNKANVAFQVEYTIELDKSAPNE
jgi:hypothetical protein